MKFNKKCIYTGKTIKVSKRGNRYVLLNFLDDDVETWLKRRVKPYAP